MHSAKVQNLHSGCGFSLLHMLAVHLKLLHFYKLKLKNTSRLQAKHLAKNLLLSTLWPNFFGQEYMDVKCFVRLIDTKITIDWHQLCLSSSFDLIVAKLLRTLRILYSCHCNLLFVLFQPTF